MSRTPASSRTPRTPKTRVKTPRMVETASGPASVGRLAPRVGFFGLGAMGLPMAMNVARAGLPLQVWNREPPRAAALVKAGATIASSPRACAEGADVLVMMLRDGDALLDVLGRDGAGPRGWGSDGAIAGLKRRALVIDMSTSGRAAAREAARVLEAAGHAFVDAPVSGTVGPAERGDLLAMVGGKLKDVSRAEPVLRAMCKRILHAGPVGQGQTLKVILNGLGAHHMIAFTSMLALAERSGLARDVAIEAFTGSAFASPSYLGKRAKVLARDYSPEFSLDLTRKDAALNLALQDEVGLRLPVLREIVREIDEAIAGGLGPEDLYAMEKYFARTRT